MSLNNIPAAAVALAFLITASAEAQSSEPRHGFVNMHFDAGGLIDMNDFQYGPAGSLAGTLRISSMVRLGVRVGAAHQLYRRETSCRWERSSYDDSWYPSLPSLNCTSTEYAPLTTLRTEAVLQLGRRTATGEIGSGLRYRWGGHRSRGLGGEASIGIRLDTRPLGGFARLQVGYNFETRGIDAVMLFGASLSPRANR